METVNLVSGRLAIHPRSFFLDRKRIKRPTVCRNTSNNDNTSSDAREKYASLGSWNARFGLAQEKLPKRVLSTTLPADKEKVQPGMTVYSVRITTSTERGSELTSLYGGIWLCMIGKDGSSILHRFSPVVDSTDLQNQLFEICETDSWEEAGANCSVSEVPQTPSSQWNSKSVKHRFREGSVDEESFMAPELGPLSAVIIGPEDGAWRLHEVNISSSRTGHSDRFICRQRMGCKNSERSAAYLTPVPEDAVVYGSGESAVIMSKAEAAKVYSRGMQDYSDLKQQLLLTNLALVAGGCVVMGLIDGIDGMVPMAIGGGLGMFYQWSLQQAVDRLPSALSADYDTGPDSKPAILEPILSGLGSLLSKPAVRFLMTTALACIAFQAAENLSGAGLEADTKAEAAAANGRLLRVLLTIMGGFMLHKLSIVAVSLKPEEAAQAQASVARKKVNET
uniref:DUF7755 domain-containing protein n=1 Tax=Tetraselmis sp. GSL018 TaxID=582737 RepID=A0A061R9H7_9CHLO|mmetsp:Transcript_41843/g.99254  ORF Transcript_41843/g.99254 Transcript_41843/m.99254 type:complete len:450 (-) Transcript_41843:187-1536(-)